MIGFTELYQFCLEYWWVCIPFGAMIISFIVYTHYDHLELIEQRRQSALLRELYIKQKQGEASSYKKRRRKRNAQLKRSPLG